MIECKMTPALGGDLSVKLAQGRKLQRFIDDMKMKMTVLFHVKDRPIRIMAVDTPADFIKLSGWQTTGRDCGCGCESESKYEGPSFTYEEWRRIYTGEARK